MSFTTWIFDPKIPFENLSLATKTQSYTFGRRIYTFQANQQAYWLKFHQANSQHILAKAFQRELNFYQLHQHTQQPFLLPYQIIQFSDVVNQLDAMEGGGGLLTANSDAFFTALTDDSEIESIQQKILAALDTLDALHQLGWIHGDLKTEHFRFYENSCRLIDFEQCFRIGFPIQTLDATPHYMAPELFQGTGKTIQSDLYALGIILYEWLTQLTLKAGSYHDWAVLHCQQLQIQLPSTLQCFFPVLKGLLEKHIEQRFSSVSAAKAALNAKDLLENKNK
ncbi:protein kinase domain-containing protein [Acinetobacter sp. NIPH 2100]|uniref:protein kinase domain-containing protein n=1 Tax=Acinetobacter sp. NIPH 2100 TaxID=1217708 RepID=UPI0002CFAAF3|nr:protein kinase [Acinetobacter sp. NIPH 2100]ENX40980.1 hypothetical protein F887_02462 [Acinetobacter sp. NIPH 2100]